MSAKPFRLRVQETLTAELESISVAAGYSGDLAGRVFRGRNMFGEDDPLPMIAILETPEMPDTPVTPAGASAGRTTYKLIIQGFAEDDKANPTDPAQYILADVKRKLVELRKQVGSSNGLLGFGLKGSIVENIKIGTGVVRPPDELSANAYFWLSVELDLVEDHANPFA